VQSVVLADAHADVLSTAIADLIGSAWFIQLRGGDVAHLTVSCLDLSGAEAPIVALARDLLGQL
jgi:hypothetical protein